jgi:transcriptional regulator with XRE-family HTH domain
MDIASRLDMAMAAKGFRDQKHLARESGVPHSTINRILSGRNKSMSITHGQLLAKTLGVSMFWLACGDDDPNEDECIRAALISRREEKLIHNFRKCDADGKSAILSAAEITKQFSPSS